jgi:hypothetical protein
MMQAIRSTRPGGRVGYVGVAHEVELPGLELFFAEGYTAMNERRAIKALLKP